MSDTYPHAGGLADRLCKYFLRERGIAHVDDSWIAETNHLALREVGPLLAGAVQHNWLIKAPIEGQRLRFRYSRGPALVALGAGRVATAAPAVAEPLTSGRLGTEDVCRVFDVPAHLVSNEPRVTAAETALGNLISDQVAASHGSKRHRLPPLDVAALEVKSGPPPTPTRVPGGRYAEVFKRLPKADTYTLVPIAYMAAIKSAARKVSRQMPGTKFTVVREPCGLLCRVHRDA